MLNIPRRKLYSTAFPLNKTRPGRSRLVPASSSVRTDDAKEEDTTLAETDNITEEEASLTEAGDGEDTSLAETNEMADEASSLAEMGDAGDDSSSPVETDDVPDEGAALAEKDDAKEEDLSLADIEMCKAPSLEVDTQDTSDIAEMETHKTPSLEVDTQDAGDVAEIETHKIPSLALDSKDGGDLADEETRKTPSVALASPDAHDIVDQETHKTPSFSPPVSQDSVVPPDAEKAAAAPPTPDKPPAPVKMPAQTIKKRKRARISRRKQALLLVLTCMMLIPSFIVVFEAVNAFMLYKQMQDGLVHLQNAQALFRGNGSATTRGLGQAQPLLSVYFDTHRLRRAMVEISAAHTDFVSLSNKLDHSDSVALAANFMSSRVSTLRALGHIAVVGTAVAQQVIQTTIEVAPSVAPALQLGIASSDTLPIKPYITPSVFQKITNMLDTITPLIHDMHVYARNLVLDTLPLSEKQHHTLASLLTLLPVLETDLLQARGFKNELRWLLGVDEPRTFLVEPMDRAELRATGGFTGQFGDLIFSGAHMGPLKLANVGKYEEDHTIEGSLPDKIVYPKIIGQNAPAAYANWWPVGNFGLRDANLSADFPTSARIAMDRYEYEFNKKVDGVVMFTPTLIKQILHITGPLVISSYQETITEYNLEDRLHYYQLDNKGIRREEIVEHVEDTQIARKLFTQKVTAALFSKVTHLPFDKLLPMANQMLQSMKGKDLQVYVKNPQLESLIGLYGSTASLDRSTNHDGLFIVQSNLSASKASQYVTTSVQDAITLDKKGGATHNLQVTLDYQQRGDVYGFDTYRDYLRVYVPINSRLLTGNGFDQYARPYCGDAQSRYRPCLPDVYGDGSLICAGPVKIGYATSYLHDPYARKDHPLDAIGSPQNQQSDEAGRAMFGGWVVIPKNCVMKVTLSWDVLPMGEQPYSLLLQAQAGVSSPLNLAIHPTPGTCMLSRKDTPHFSGSMDGRDMSFTLQARRSRCSLAVQ